MKFKSCFFAFTILIFTLITSCGKKTVINSENSTQLKLSDAAETAFYDEPVSHPITGKKIAVLLGYGFNSPETAKEYSDFLEEKFSLEKNNGMLLVMNYPEDFKRTGRSFATEFFNIITNDELDLCGIITLGAPEFTHLALARNQDKWDEEVPYPVISLFPQDDILGIEATNDIVLDKGQSIEIEDELSDSSDSGEKSNTSPFSEDDSTKQILASVINYVSMAEGPLSELNELQAHLSKILKNAKFHNYTDPETGLKSINHFVLD